METWRHTLDAAPEAGPTVLTLGNFDGMHLGHRQLVRAAVTQARSLGIKAAAVTFDPHPATVVAPERRPRLLMTLAQKLAALREEGVDLAWVVPFSRGFSELEPRVFLHELARTLKPQVLHVGKGFRFGRDRAGDADLLEAWGQQSDCDVRAYAFRAEDGGPLSSTRVREALEIGDVAEVQSLLGCPYVLTGVVEDGDRRGRHLGFPTANLGWEQEQLPAMGVYVTEVRGHLLGGPRLGLTNVGEKPTFEGLRLTVETYIPDFSGDLYGSRLELAFLHRLRGEERFANLDALVARIRLDVEKGQAWWREHRG